MEIVDGKKNSGKDYCGDHGVGMEVLREDRDGISELPESKSSTQGSSLKAQDRTNKYGVLPVCYRIILGLLGERNFQNPEHPVEMVQYSCFSRDMGLQQNLKFLDCCLDPKSRMIR
jgi:hypothetical protein